MTHEHHGPCSGSLAAANAGGSSQRPLRLVTGSAAPDYYAKHHDVPKKNGLAAGRPALRCYQQRHPDDPWLAMMIRQQQPLLPGRRLGVTTGDYVDHLRTLAPADKTTLRGPHHRSEG